MNRKISIKIDNNIQFILNKLQQYGQGYIVGGYVRDSLVGYEPKDCDFVTDIEYDRLLEIFKEYNPKEIGKHFGIIQININGIDYEIAKMRQDKGIPKDRKNQEIEFTNDIYEDLKRRDFTINSIAYDGEKIYYLNKMDLDDLENRRIKFVGEIDKRIKEDPLRIMRYFRFISRGFNAYDDCDIHKVISNRELLKNISFERIRDEFNKILESKEIYSILQLMNETGILTIIIPEWETTINFEQRNKHHLYTVDQHILKAVECVEPDLITRLALLLHDIGKPRCFTIGEDGQGHFYGHEKISAEMAEIILKRLKYDNKTIERVVKLIKYHIFYRSEIDSYYVKKMLNRFGEEDIYRFIKVIEADKIAHTPPYDFISIDKMKIYLYQILKDKLPISIKDLEIDGKEILEYLDIKQGKIVGEILKFLLNEVLNRPELNNRNELLKLAENYISKKE